MADAGVSLVNRPPPGTKWAFINAQKGRPSEDPSLGPMSSCSSFMLLSRNLSGRPEVLVAQRGNVHGLDYHEPLGWKLCSDLEGATEAISNHFPGGRDFGDGRVHRVWGVCTKSPFSHVITRTSGE